jgi:uncharacterized protein (DUF2126 family)
MAGVGEQELYQESRLRERRLEAYSHWDELLVRLQHRWAPDRVIRWHEQQYPGEPCPPKTTLFRYVKSKPPGWFISRLVLAESGTRTVRNQLVVERQSELIESLVMRLQAARQFEEGMNGLLIPEVTKNYELLSRLLVEHFRVLQEMGLEPKHGSMAPAPAGAEPGAGGVDRIARMIVELPKEQFLPLLHDMYRAQYERRKPPVIDVRARHVEPKSGTAAE